MIDKNKLFTNMNTTQSLGVPFKRANAFPLERYSLFSTLEEAQEYAQNNAVAYPGQIIAIIPDDAEGAVSQYVIQLDGTLKELGNAEAIQAVNDELNNILAGRNYAYNSYYATYYSKEEGVAPIAQVFETIIQELNDILYGDPQYGSRLPWITYYSKYYTEISGDIDTSRPMPTIAEAIGGKLDRYGWSNDHVDKVLVIKPGGIIEPGNPTIEGSVEVAKKLETARTIGLTGDIVASSTFDGTQDMLLNVTAPGGIVTGTYHNTGLGAFTPAGSTTPITSFRTDRLYLDTSSDTNYHNRFYISKDGITLIEFKLNLDDIYTKTETDNKISTSLSNYYTKSDVSNLLSGYVVSSTLNNYVTVTALNTTLNNYVVKSTLDSYYTKSGINEVLGNYYATISSIPKGALAKKDTVAKSDLSTSVQASLDKADTALQSFTETDPTVPAWAKAATKPTYTAAEVGAATEDFVITEINKVLTSGGEVDLSNYYTSNQTIAHVSNALDNYYSKDNTMVAVWAALAPYYSKDQTTNYVDTALTSYHTKSEVSDLLDDYATTSWVSQEIAKVSTGGSVDLTNYFTKTETNAAIASALADIDTLQTNSNEFKIADNAGRVILQVDKDGLYTTDVCLPGISLAERVSNWDNKSTVNWEQEVTSGTKIATISINGETTEVYAPTSTSSGTSTDEKVKQTATTTSGDFPILLRGTSAGTTTTTAGTSFPATGLTFNPNSKAFKVWQIYSDGYYTSNGTKLDDIYASKDETASAGQTVNIKSPGNSLATNLNFLIPFTGASATTAGFTSSLNSNAKFAFNPSTHALTIGNYTNPWEKTFITDEGLSIDRYYFTGILESTSKVSDTYRIKTIYANGEGGLYAKKYYTNGSDFAEYFEWLDGNPNNEDRCGILVALVGECIRPANADDECIGAITGSASYIGNAYDNEWQGKYLTDVYGRPLTREVQVPAQTDAITGEVIQAAYTTQEYVINPEYNPMIPYVSRTERREWAIVGLTGQVVVRDDGTCVAGSYLAPSKNGIGTISDKGYRVMKRIDENHVKVLIK